MVFLRLTVKVPPRVSPDIHRPRNSNTDGTTTNGANGKTIAFLVPVPNPEEITLGGLAGLIQEKWKKLRPNASSLDIKKILDEQHPDENLDVDLTVADVFVQHGRAAADGQDQRATVLVVQNPVIINTYTREDSVFQDWAGAATSSQSLFRPTTHSFRQPSKIHTIKEDEPLLDHNSTRTDNEFLRDGSNYSHYDIHDADIPMNSVEREKPEDVHERLESPSHNDEFATDDREVLESSPNLPRDVSEELGDSPIPKNAHMSYLERIEEENTKVSSEGRGESHDQKVEKQEPTVNGSENATRIQEAPQSHLETVTHSAKDALPNGTVKNTATSATPQTDAIGDIDMVDANDSAGKSVAETTHQAQSQNHLPRHGDTNHTPNSDDKISRGAAAAKRKRRSLDELPPSKEPRLELTTIPSTPASRKKQRAESNGIVSQDVEPTPTIRPRSRERAPSFSSPQKAFRSSIRAPNLPPGSLGLGITSSPGSRLSKKTHDVFDIDKSVSKSLFTQDKEPALSQSLASTTSKLGIATEDSTANHRSALRKKSPAERNHNRRSISFVDDEVVETTSAREPQVTFKPPNIERRVASPSVSASEGSRSTPHRYTSVWPSNVPRERLEKYIEESKCTTEKDPEAVKNLDSTHVQQSKPSVAIKDDPKRSLAKSTQRGSTPSAEHPSNSKKSDSAGKAAGEAAGDHPKKTAKKKQSQRLSDFVKVDYDSSSSDSDENSLNLRKRKTPDSSFADNNILTPAEKARNGIKVPSVVVSKSVLENRAPITTGKRKTPDSSMTDDNLLPQTEKVRNGIKAPSVEISKSLPEKRAPTTKTKPMAKRTISTMKPDLSSQINRATKSPPREHVKEVKARSVSDASQSSLATKQLNSELESAHHESAVKSSLPVSTVDPAAEKPAGDSKSSSSSSSNSENESDTSGPGSESESESESESDSESASEPESEPELKSDVKSKPNGAPEAKSKLKAEPSRAGSQPKSKSNSESTSSSGSDSESESDSDGGLFAHMKDDQNVPIPKKQDVSFSQPIFGSSNGFTSVNTAKRHTFSTLREDMRKEQEARKSQNTTPDANQTPRRRDIFEMPSGDDSDSSDYDDDSHNDNRGDILPTGKARSLSLRKQNQPARR